VDRHAREAGLGGLHGAVEDGLQSGAVRARGLARLHVRAGGRDGGGEHRRTGQRGDARGRQPGRRREAAGIGRGSRIIG
jgi:hypothetical protein